MKTYTLTTIIEGETHFQEFTTEQGAEDAALYFNLKFYIIEVSA